MKKTKLDDDFKDITKLSEKSLKEVWDNKEDDVLEKASELRPKYADKLNRIKKQKGIRFKSTDELRKKIEC